MRNIIKTEFFSLADESYGGNMYLLKENCPTTGLEATAHYDRIMQHLGVSDPTLLSAINNDITYNEVSYFAAKDPVGKKQYIDPNDCMTEQAYLDTAVHGYTVLPNPTHSQTLGYIMYKRNLIPCYFSWEGGQSLCIIPTSAIA